MFTFSRMKHISTATYFAKCFLKSRAVSFTRLPIRFPRADMELAIVSTQKNIR
jgi:hypothetical protein